MTVYEILLLYGYIFQYIYIHCNIKTLLNPTASENRFVLLIYSYCGSSGRVGAVGSGPGGVGPSLGDGGAGTRMVVPVT